MSLETVVAATPSLPDQSGGKNTRKSRKEREVLYTSSKTHETRLYTDNK